MADFLIAYRPYVPAFSEDEKNAIGDFARRHPLALQVACDHVLEAKQSGKQSLPDALNDARNELNALMPSGW